MAFKFNKLKTFFTIFLFVGILVFSNNAFCVTEKNLLHIPPSGMNFGAEGLPMVLQAKLFGTRNVNHKIRLIAVIDGHVMDVPSRQVYWDENDKPVYDFDVYFPKESLSYRFVIDTYSSVNKSKRFISGTYNVYRNCKLKKEYTGKKNDILQKASEEALIAERDVSVREHIVKLINEIENKADF